MGAVDLVIQVESPKSVTRGLQRIGRAGHGVGEVSRGRIFPKFRADLLECAVVARRMREGLIETHRRAAQPARRARAAGGRHRRERRGRGRGRRRAPRPLPAHVHLRRAGAAAARQRARHAGRPLSLGGVRRAALADRLGPGRRHGPRAHAARGRSRSSTRAPSRTAACSASTCRTAAGSASSTRRWCTRRARGRRSCWAPPRGASSRSPATAWSSRRRRACRGRCRSGTATASGGRASWARPSARSRARPCAATRPEPAGGLRPGRAGRLQPARLPARAGGGHRRRAVDRTLVVERFRDEIGDWRLCVLSPYGGRVHAAWALALSARIRDAFGLESDAIWSDDGIIVHLPDADEPPGAELVLVDPEEAEDLVVAELGASALFGARFRENAALARCSSRGRIPAAARRSGSSASRRSRCSRWRGGTRSSRSSSRRTASACATSSTCPVSQDLLRKLSTREIALIEVETPTASPFASSLLFDYVAAYMYEGDTPAAERRAVALVAGPRPAARAARPGGAARPHRPGGAGAGRGRPAAPLGAPAGAGRRRAARRAAARRRPDGGGGGASARSRPSDAGAWLARLEDERRAVRVRVGGEERWVGGRGRRAVPRRPRRRPARRPARRVPRGRAGRAAAAAAPLRALARPVRDQRGARPLRRRPRPGARRARAGRRPGARRAAARCGTQREWCDPDVLRRVRRASLAVAAQGDRAGRPRDARAVRSGLAGRRPLRRRRAPASTGCATCWRRSRALPLAPEVWEKDVLPRRLGTYSPYWLDELCASGEVVWVGAGPLGRADRARRAVLPRRRAAARVRRRGAAEAPGGELHEAAARAARPRRLLLLRPAGRAPGRSARRSSARRSGTSRGPAR